MEFGQEEFYSWPAPPPEGEWGYIVDDSQVVFGPGWWPFYHDHGFPGRARRRTGVRISPDCRFYSWGQEYVLLYPTDGHTAATTLKLYRRPQGMGAIVVPVHVELDICARTFTVGDHCPDDLREQAEMKAQKLLDYVLAARRERGDGSTRPRTAADIEDEREAASQP